MISVLVVCYNEAKHIIECLNGIESQFNSDDKWELIIIDGCSTDDTVNIAHAFLKDKKYAWQIINNPKKTLATGWNLGIKQAKGDYIIRPDAHAKLHENYIKGALEVLEKNENLAAVGGVLITESEGFWGNIIKEALSTKVGVGNSGFRVGAESGYADTAVYALYRKNVYDTVGLFNEKLVRHQDTEMHYRIKKAGFGFWLNADIKASYFCRNTLSGLLNQMYNIGKYLPMLPRMGALGALRFRHWIPFLFYFGILILLAFSGYQLIRFLLFATLISYFGIILLVSIKKIVECKNISLLLFIITIPLMHLFYAIGFFIGIINTK